MTVAAGRRIDVTGTVQGVGYRPWIYRLATELGIAGRVFNDGGGVVIDAFGAPPALETFTERLRHEGPAASRLATLAWQPIEGAPPAGFSIEASDAAGERRLSIPPDLATCADCAAEIRDPANRRFGYPFTNCTACGPRYTILRGVPYDRPQTTMAGFVMCAACRREYDDPADRRFHAQPNACPACGPRLDPPDGIARAAAVIAAGGIVALKGLGGYHLCCDATSAAAVRRLRQRKQREGKPLAVMVADLAAARTLAQVSPEEARLLDSPARPIVILRRTSPVSDLSDTPTLGIFLPYTPLHHLLLAAAGRPLVMTSGNLHDEPIVFRDEEALARLAGVADFFLLHDRPIEARCDDSVARVIDGAPVVLRRARGWVPAPVRLRRPFARPVLAVGADLKNAFCLGVGDVAYLGPHVGDLEHAESVDALAEGVDRLIALVGVTPEVVAYDLHPGYVSSDWARRRPEAVKVGVQHHHAHVVSCMAEHGLADRVLGVAFDGTGWGPDGTAWGGEILLADAARAERVGTFRPVALPGADRAIQEPWRAALAALDDAFDGDPPLARLSLFDGVPARDVALVRRMLAERLCCPQARGVGRWFDVFAAIGLALPRVSYEGQAAIRWEHAVDPAERGRYPWASAAGEIDLRPTLRAAVADLVRGRRAGVIAARFHATIVAATSDVIAGCGAAEVVLTGGCFQNAWLSEGLAGALRAQGRRVYVHAQVPPGDGGIALGQAVVADARARSM